MFPSIDDLLKAQSEAFKTSNTVATAAFDGAKKLLELIVQAARAGMEESSAQLKALMAAKDVNTLNTMLADLFAQYGKPDGSKAASYVKNVYEITQETSAQVSALIEQQVSNTQRQLLASVDTLVKNAPAGSESAVNLLKQSVVNANAAYEQLQAASKQVLEMIDANIAGLSKAASAPKKK